jgi:ketosteroid isomerase-like protein
MSQVNVEVVRRSYAAYNAAVSAPNPRKALRAATERVADPAIEWVIEPTALDARPTPYRGIDGVMEFFDGVLEAFEQIRQIPERFIDRGDRVLVFVRAEARTRAPVIELDEKWAHLVTVRDGKILRLQQFRDRDEALEAAGLTE